ncbi:ferritin-like domain-containing protein [Haloferax mucosum]|nr:ferritin-like domain-containing protein [Haloferax mucosum]
MFPNDKPATPRTRRAFLGTTATATLLALAGCTGDGGSGSEPTETTTATESPMTTTEEPTTTDEPMGNPDVPILNYALTLEHLENAFYRDGLETFSDDELMEADSLSMFGERIRREVPEYLAVIGEHEAAHVEALTKTVEDLGGTAVKEGTYDFGYETPSEFLGVAKALENTGVAAYAGAAPSVVSNDILSAAAGIHSVEARHASFLNLVNGDSPYPKAVDEASTMTEVLDIAGGFITSEVDPSVYETNEMSRPEPDRKMDDGTTDVDVLNYALTLEHLENAFYRDGLEEFSPDEIASASALSDFGETFRSNIHEHLQQVGAHEAAHVEALTKTVEEFDGTPVEEATYDFGYETPSEFLGVAKALENTGVAAYAGAAPSVTSDAVFSAALGIHSVEARHASFLNELNATSPFPDGVDESKSMDEVVEIASQFIVSD